MRGANDVRGGLDYFDFACVIVMGLIAAVTFSLDKSLLVGFWLYTLKGALQRRGRVDRYLLGSSVLLSIAMGIQYFTF